MSTATEAVQTFRIISLAHIAPSPMNPRRHFDDKALKELAESIRTHGVQQPIVVRPDGNKQDRFEIVVGERRFRASKLAGKSDIPALINPLSNAAALEIMVIENLQREDVHPLDEALGYEALMKKASEADPELGELPGAPRHTADSIAVKIGKSKEYVYARLKLLALVPAGREAFQSDRITAGHAVLIARLTPKDQVTALKACFDDYLTNDTLDRLKKLDPLTAKFEDVVDTEFTEPRLAPEKWLREWIQEHINLKLKGVPWDLGDDKLLPEAGACALCPKRSMSNPSLFAELTKKGEDDTCFDPTCYQAKQKAFVKLLVKSAKDAPTPLVQISDQTAYTKPKEGEKILKKGQWVAAKKGECKAVELALIVRGENAGGHRTVCTDLSCKVHQRHLQSSSTSFSPAENHQNRAAEEEKQRINDLVVEKTLAAAVAKIKKPDAKALGAVVDARLSNWYGDLALVGRVLGLKFKSEDDSNAAVLAFRKKADLAGLTRLLFLVELSDDLVAWSPELKAAAKAYGVDMAKIRKGLEKPAVADKKAKGAKAGK